MIELEEIIDELEEFEELIDNLITASRVVYDASYHAHVMQVSAKLMQKVMASGIAAEDKMIFLNTINTLFQRALIEIKS